MPKQNAAAPEPFHLGHDALAGLTVGPESRAVQEAGGLVHLEGEHVTVIASPEAGTRPEPLRPIDPKGGAVPAINPGTKIE